MSTSEQHAYPPRGPSGQAAWGRSDTHYRRAAALPTPSPHAGFQAHVQQTQVQAAHKNGAWNAMAGYMAGPMLPPPASYSRSTTVSPPVSAPCAPPSLQAAHPYTLAPLSTPITPVHPSSPPPLPAAKQAPAASAKRRRSGSPSRTTSPASPGTEAARILEERRRRNASASARFRKRRNERERELLARCLFLEQHLLGCVGARAFDEIIRRAPGVGPADAAVLGNRRALAGRSAASSRAPSPRDDESDAELAAMSVGALTAPRSVDDVWAACMALGQQVADAVQRIGVLESAGK